MLDGILDAAFLQAACAHKNNIIKLVASPNVSALQIRNIAANGTCAIIYTEGGVKKKYTFSSSLDNFTVPADAHSNVFIIGDVTSIDIQNTTWGLIDTRENIVLGYLHLNFYLREMNIGASVSQLDADNAMDYIETISYPGNNNAVSSKIADIITNSDNDDGTLYTDADGTYYNTLATAATAKGWTIVTSNND